MRPFSVDQIVAVLHARGDKRSAGAIRIHVIRAIESGSLPGYKVNPDRVTSPWLVPAENVEAWLGAAKSKERSGG